MSSCSPEFYLEFETPFRPDLVGGLEHVWNLSFGSHHPKWRTHIFQRGGEKPPASKFTVIDLEIVDLLIIDGDLAINMISQQGGTPQNYKLLRIPLDI